MRKALAHLALLAGLGIVSSHRGRDMAALLGRLVELGYGVAYRTLDARHFGVPQRRRRIFILALRSGPDDPDGHLAAERAAEVLAVGTRCERHPPSGGQAGAGAAGGAGGSTHGSVADGATTSRTVQAGFGNHGYSIGAQDADGGFIVPEYTTAVHTSADGRVRSCDVFGRRSGPSGDEARNLVAGPPPDARGVRAAPGIPGRLLDREVVAYVKRKRAQTTEDDESWGDGDVSPTLNGFDVGDARAVTLVAEAFADEAATILASPDGGTRMTDLNQTWVLAGPVADDQLLPPGLDSARYRAMGNAVCVPVAEWIGQRLAEEMSR